MPDSLGGIVETLSCGLPPMFLGPQLYHGPFLRVSGTIWCRAGWPARKRITPSTAIAVERPRNMSKKRIMSYAISGLAAGGTHVARGMASQMRPVREDPVLGHDRLGN